MLVIRLRRIGKKNKPTYRVVVAEHTWAAAGKFTVDLGFYNPHTKEIKVDKETVLAWLKKGAKPSNTVAKLLQNLKFKHASIVVVKRHKKAKVAEEKAVVVKADITEKGEVETEIKTDQATAEQAEQEVAEATETPTPENPEA